MFTSNAILLQGVIFAVDYNHRARIICSTSDDRSARLWSVEGENLIDSKIQPKCTLYGHSARIFRCNISDNYVITGGEDGRVNVWNLDGSLAKRIESNQGTSVWTLDSSESENIVVVGSGDCSITAFALKGEPKKVVVGFPGNRVVRKLGFVGEYGDVAAICEGGDLLLYHFDAEKWTDVANHDDLKSYALLEVSSCRDLVGLAGK